MKTATQLANEIQDVLNLLDDIRVIVDTQSNTEEDYYNLVYQQHELVSQLAALIGLRSIDCFKASIYKGATFYIALSELRDVLKEIANMPSGD